jgi:outer membrane protein assembly factor BamB
MRARSLLVIGFCTACLSASGRAEDWPQFRGAGGTGLTSERNLPHEWSPSKNVRWKVEIPGAGWSSPIVWGDRIFVTTAIAENHTKPQPQPSNGIERPNPEIEHPPDVIYRWKVFCLSRSTGNVLWEQLALEAKPRIPTHPNNTYASETPVTDGKRVYAYFGMTGLFCYDFAGKFIWKKDLGSYRVNGPGWGTGSSPVLDGDRLFVQCDNDEQSFLVALDKQTGAELWRVRRDETTNYSTPLIWRNKQRTELVLGGQKVRSYDLATGKVLWELTVNGYCWCGSPVGDEEHVYVGAAGKGGAFAVKAGASGELILKPGESSNAGIAWFQPKGGTGDRASPVIYQGYLYTLEQSGWLTCFEAKTGRLAYRHERLTGARDCFASLWAYDGKVFCLSGDDGLTFVLQAGPAFKVLAKNPLREMMWSTPAISGGALFMRGIDHMYCIKQ